MPPAVVYGEDGQALYSWRVLLLPYIEGEGLYEEFHLDEPWDIPHNRALLPRRPASYAPPRWKASKVPPDHTVIHVFVGPGTAFEGREGTRLPQDFTKGTSNTFLIIEAGRPVPWTKPDELVYDPAGPLPNLQGLFPDGFRASLADCHVRFVRKDVSASTLRWVISRNDPGPRTGEW